MMKKILVVDDNTVNQTVLIKLLNNISPEYLIVTADNGEIAVTMFEETHQDLALIFMDIMMPKMNGLEATKCIRKIEQSNGSPKQETPIIGVTAFGKDFPKDLCKESGMNYLIEKPVRKSIVEKTIREFSLI